MREDARILTELDEFVFVGFSIKWRNVPTVPDYKPGCEVVTADRLVSQLHSSVEKRPPERVGDLVNPVHGMVYDSGLAISIYNTLSPEEKSEYALYGYAVELDRVFTYRLYDGSPGAEDGHRLVTFAHAVRRPVQPLGEFLGYDVIDSDGGVSGLTNCDIHWTDAERCGELNSHHLFSKYSDAACFRDVADRLVEEHSPFAVWAIFEVADLKQTRTP